MDSLNIILGRDILTPRGGLNLFRGSIPTMYTLLGTSGSGAFTLPASVTSFNAFAYGGGGGGSGSEVFKSSNNQGGGGGGGGKGSATYTKTTAGVLAVTTSVGGAGAQGIERASGGDAGGSTLTANSSNFISVGGGLGSVKPVILPGNGGTGGTTGVVGAITGFTQVTIENAAGMDGTAGVTNSGAGSGGDVGGGAGVDPLTGSEGDGPTGRSFGQLAGFSGVAPGGGGSGGISGGGSPSDQRGGAGSQGRIIVQVFGPNGLLISDFNLTNFSFTDNGPV